MEQSKMTTTSEILAVFIGCDKVYLAELIKNLKIKCKKKDKDQLIAWPDAFRLFAVAYLSMSLGVDESVASTLIKDHDISLENRNPIIRLHNDGLLSIKLRLVDLKSKFISGIEDLARQAKNRKGKK